MKSERSRLTARIDKNFSIYIRYRDSVDGMCKCITCPSRLTPKELHAGHFISRGCALTRWDERNVHAQCAGCNTYRFGEQAKYLVALEDKYGREVVDELMELERKWRAGGKSFGIGELRELDAKYKQLAKEVQNN